jgi:exodeoxyribonuclease-3
MSTMLRLYSWNVNGIRAVMRKDVLVPFIAQHSPDVLCLQETKASESQAELKLDGYNQYWYSADKPGYSGTAIFTKLKPLSVVNGLPTDIIKEFKVSGDIYGDPNKEGRVMVAEYDKYFIMTVYTPNAKDDLSRLELRHKQWDPAFLKYAESLEKSKPVIFCGDLNVAHTADDLANPKPNEGKKGFTKQERAGFEAFIKAGFVDTFRVFHSGNGFYTWWSHFANARARNVGWRIDYILASKSLKNYVRSADIHPKVLGSDHCPISLELAL